MRIVIQDILNRIKLETITSGRCDNFRIFRLRNNKTHLVQFIWETIYVCCCCQQN